MAAASACIAIDVWLLLEAYICARVKLCTTFKRALDEDLFKTLSDVQKTAASYL